MLSRDERAAMARDLAASTEATIAGRTARPRDLGAENRAFLALMDELAQRPETVLQALCQVVVDFCHAGSAGISLIAGDEGAEHFFWPAVAGAWAAYVGGTMPRDASPCGIVVETGQSLLFPGSHPFFAPFSDAEFPIVEVLLAPFSLDGRPVGTVWAICHSAEQVFDREDQRFLCNISHFAAAAYQAVRGADARRQVQERLNLALSNAEIIGLWDWDVRRDRIVVDQRFARMFGVTPDQATSGTSIRAFLDGVHPEDRSRLKQEIAAALRTGLPLSTEYRLLSPDGAVCDVVARGQCQRSPTGEPLRFPGVVVDVTEQRRAERALAELNAELEQRVEERTRELMVAEESIRQLQKMEAIGQLTGGIAHDFNNLLTGISGSLDLIRRRLAAGRSDDLDRFIDAAINSAQRAAALTHRLLAFARRQSLDITSQDINTLISGMADLLNRALGETIEVTTELDPALWPALTDANQFESALLNLAINARDAMPGGGRLAIETRNRHLSAAQTAAQELAPGDYVLIAVRDNGEGMSPDILSKAFDPFFTTKPIGAGTGLGLSMIYGFARQSGGHVEIESRVGVGTTVTLYLPRAAYDAANSEPCIEKAPPEGRGETVLVVEDEPAVRLLIGEVLRDLGYQKLEVQDAATAFPILDSERPIDLLITDVGLPLVDGRQLAEIAREKRPGLKILFVTGYAEKAAQRNQFLEPGMEMMAKPFALEALATKVRELLTG